MTIGRKTTEDRAASAVVFSLTATNAAYAVELEDSVHSQAYRRRLLRVRR